MIQMKREKKRHVDLAAVRKIIFKNIEPLLESLDIKYEQSGPNYFSVCPIHEGSDNNHALSISTEMMVWRCWTRGCHDAHGKDIFNFVKAVLASRTSKEITFSDALKYICKIYKINSKNISIEKREQESPNELSEIVKIFNDNKQKSETRSISKIETMDRSPYFEGRGFKTETLKFFDVKDAVCSGAMKNRAVIPVHDCDAELVAYIGRSTKSYVSPKFIFTKGFKKTDYLYNYHRAIDSITEKACVFLVEGQGDVWRLYEAGVKNCVSIFGREVSEAQKLILLNMNITKIVVLTDNDQSGRESKFKIQREFSRLFSLKFPILNKKDIGEMTIDQVKELILPQVKGCY